MELEKKALPLQYSTICKNCDHHIGNHYRDHEGGIWCRGCWCHDYRGLIPKE